MGLLKEFLSGKMLVWYVAFGGIGWAVGSYLGYPIAGALIGRGVPRAGDARVLPGCVAVR